MLFSQIACVAIHVIVGRERGNFSRQIRANFRIKRATGITDVEHGLPGDGGVELKRAATVSLQRSKYVVNTMTRSKCEMRASRQCKHASVDKLLVSTRSQ